MKAKRKNLTTLIITCVLLLFLLILTVLSNRTPMNPEGTFGNTPGNLNNGGLFCEADGKVYFSNPYDNNTLYRMNPDETKMEKLNDNPVANINVGGKYLYYSMSSNKNGSGLGFVRQTSGIYRSDLKGGKTLCLDRCHIVSMQLCQNYVYYEKYDNKKGPSLEKIRIDKKDGQTVAAEIISPNSYTDGMIYYTGTQKDHYLHALNTSTDVSSVVWKYNVWNPIWHKGALYFMDIDNDYRLCRYLPDSDTIEILTNERLDFFNIYENYIYYQVSSTTSPALKRMFVDGSSPELIREGVYENINITSEYVYFNAFQEPVPTYKTSTLGSINVTTFDAALAAVK